jgi:hypothetical protein
MSACEEDPATHAQAAGPWKMEARLHEVPVTVEAIWPVSRGWFDHFCVLGSVLIFVLRHDSRVVLLLSCCVTPREALCTLNKRTPRFIISGSQTNPS